MLADAAGRYDRILCLGDLVGYGADPNAIVEWTRENVAAVIRGNHDQGMLRRTERLEDFNPAAQASPCGPADALTGESRISGRLAARPSALRRARSDHGSPADEDEYVIGIGRRRRCWMCWMRRSRFSATRMCRADSCWRGGRHGNRRTGRLSNWNRILLLVNPGSVGQPRDGDPRAAYAIYSPEERSGGVLPGRLRRRPGSGEDSRRGVAGSLPPTRN